MKPVWYLVSIVGLSVVLSVYGAVLALKDAPFGDTLSTLWMLVFALLIALWVRVDAATQKVYRTLDFSAYFFLAWPLALPYYLTKTRGVEGLILFCGFLILHFAPFLAGLMAYVYLYTE